MPRGWENKLGLGPSEREWVLENNHLLIRVSEDNEKTTQTTSEEI